MSQTTTASGNLSSPAAVYSYTVPTSPAVLTDSTGNKAVRKDYTFSNTGNVPIVLHFLGVANPTNCSLNQAGIPNGSTMETSTTIVPGANNRIHVDVTTATLEPGSPSQTFGYDFSWNITDADGNTV